MKKGDVVEVINDMDASGTQKYKTRMGSFGVVHEVKDGGLIIEFEYISGSSDFTLPVKLYVEGKDCVIKTDIKSAEELKLKLGETIKFKGNKALYKFVKFKDANKRYLTCTPLLSMCEDFIDFHVSAIEVRPKLKPFTQKWICTKGKSETEYYWFKYKLIPEYKVKVLRSETKNLRAILTHHEKLLKEKYFGTKTDPVKELPICGKTKYYSTYIGKDKALVHNKPGTFLDIIAERYLKTIEQAKSPTDLKKNYIGVEIECFTKLSRKQLGKEFIKARLHNDVSLISDGSINGVKSGYEAIEVRVLCSEDQRYDIIRRVCKVISDAGGEYNRSCGLHVHLDMRNRNYKEVFKNLFHAQKTMLATQPESRQWNEYAMRCLSEDIEIERHVAIGGRSGRYKAINIEAYGKHKTLEIRIHEGTTNYDDIINWVDFLVDVCNAEPLKFTRETHEDLLKVIKSNEQVVKYIMSRVDKFAEENAKAKYR